MAGTLILVDDDPLMLRILGDTLKPAGFECVLARSLEEAFRAAKRHPPQAAIVDINLENGESGLEPVRTFPNDKKRPHGNRTMENPFSYQACLFPTL